MPTPTRTSDPHINLCLHMKAEHLVIRESVLKIKIYKEVLSQEKIFYKGLNSGLFLQKVRIKKLKYFVAPLWTKPVLLMEQNPKSPCQAQTTMHMQTERRLRTHPIFRGCIYTTGDTT